jgi:uncharacterized protein (TIGR02246 family)
MKALVSSFLAVAALAGACYAESVAPPDVSPEKAAVLAADRAYESAYAKADVKALADFFADDADYTTEEGDTYSGRAEIEKSIKASFKANKGARLVINMDSVKVLSPDVVLEKGSTTVISKNGAADGALYTAIYTRKDGKWKISNLVETPLPTATAHDHLAELDWLVGSWEDTDKTDNVTVRSQYTWSRGGSFLTRNVTVKRGDDTTMEGWQIIGWDPVAEAIRAWTFDDEGGFSGGTFTRDGNRWLLRETGVTPEGGRTSADSTITKVSADKFTWESTNRTLDGDPQPGVPRLEVNRVKGN